MKTDLKEYVKEIKSQISNEYIDQDFERAFVSFMNDNEWFGNEPEFDQDILMIDMEKLSPYTGRIQEFFINRGLSASEKTSKLQERYEKQMQGSAQMVKTFFEEMDIAEDSRYYLYDFLLFRQTIEFSAMDDEAVSSLMSYAVYDLTKANGDIFCMMLTWMKQFKHMHWFRDYYMTQRRVSENGAYDIDEYLELLYYLFNESYIEKEEMYRKAAESKNYADTWLYMCMHFMRAIRNTDLKRIGHPELTLPPEEVLQKVASGDFSQEDARLTVYSITWRLAVLPLVPNKTRAHGGVTSLKITIPESLEVHMGILLAVCEAHYQLSRANNDDDSAPLIRVISDYERINRYMGEEIGVLFLRSNFRSRGVQKSYLQGLFMMTDDILGDERDEFNVKGYILAALARSHKGSYGEFAKTTVVYLKDAKFNGLTPEFVARELFERGVLSFIPSMLLNIVSGNRYSYLPAKIQTEAVKALDMTPAEVESLVKLSENARQRSSETVKNLFIDKDSSPSEILMILHRIGGGYAVSKCDELLCIMTAMKKVCPFPERHNCFGCKYEIGTKSTIFSMASEYNRLKALAKSARSDIERRKYIHLIKSVVLPVLEEVLVCLKQNYGDEVASAYERIIRECL